MALVVRTLYARLTYTEYRGLYAGGEEEHITVNDDIRFNEATVLINFADNSYVVREVDYLTFDEPTDAELDEVYKYSGFRFPVFISQVLSENRNDLTVIPRDFIKDEFGATELADTLDGTSGDDFMRGFEGDDTLSGKAGNDELDGGKGADDLDGGQGDDLLIGDKGDDRLAGGKGDDELGGGKGIDTLIGDQGRDTLDGGSEDDDLSGGDGKDTLIGGKGDDTLAGDAGKDKLDGGKGDDTLSGGDGNDKLNGGSGDDTLTGGAGNDKLKGKSGDDDLNGGADDDTLFGHGGDDILTGGRGLDSMEGASGADTYRFFIGDGTDTVSEAGGDADRSIEDVIFLADTAFLNTVRLTQSGDDLLILYGSSDRITVTDFFVADEYKVETLRGFTGLEIDLTQDPADWLS